MLRKGLAAMLAASAALAASSAPSSKNTPERDEERGRQLVENICTLCHEIDRVKQQHLSKQEWSGEIKGMIAEGAPVTDEEFNLIVNYLAEHYGDAQ